MVEQLTHEPKLEALNLAPLVSSDKGSCTTSKAGLKEYSALRSQSGWQGALSKRIGQQWWHYGRTIDSWTQIRWFESSSLWYPQIREVALLARQDSRSILHLGLNDVGKGTLYKRNGQQWWHYGGIIVESSPLWQSQRQSQIREVALQARKGSRSHLVLDQFGKGT